MQKTTTNKSTLFLPIEFWSSIISTVDAKVQTLSEAYGFGTITITFVVHRGKVSEIYFDDRIRLKGMLEKITDKLDKKNNV